MSGSDRAPAYGFAVEKLFVASGGLDGVADGVAVVEDHAQAGLALVVGDDVGLDADAGGDDVGERFGVSAEDGVGVLLHVFEELWIADDPGLDGLLQACAEL